MAEAVKPGGWIFAEEPDYVTEEADPSAPEAWRDLYTKLMRELYRVAKERGVDPFFGACVFGLLYSLGFEALQAVGRTQMMQDGSPEAVFHRLLFEQLQEPILAPGQVNAQEFNDLLSLLENPALAWRWDLRTSACVVHRRKRF